MPQPILTPEHMLQLSQDWRSRGETIAFVPTMGALHDGHLNLVLQAKGQADRVVVSIFVNPMQFGPKEDFSRYPRTLKEDLERLDPLGVDAVFVPNVEHIYPKDFQTTIHNKTMANQLCGLSRPGHFDGVLTVVLKLFNLVRPDIAIFGKKDYQQLSLIRQMQHDLILPVQVVGVDTVREKSGLAMSSRNRYLSDEQRSQAAAIYEAMQTTLKLFKAGERRTQTLEQAAASMLNSFEIEYVAIRTQDGLRECPEKVEENVVLLIAVKHNGVRLIDNIELIINAT